MPLCFYFSEYFFNLAIGANEERCAMNAEKLSSHKLLSPLRAIRGRDRMILVCKKSKWKIKLRYEFLV